MCGPALGLIGAVVSAAGSLVTGAMQAQAANAQAAQYERQAQIERDKGIFEAQRERERFRTVAGSQRAAFLQSGVLIEGTPEEVLVDAELENEIDVQTIRYGAQIREQNYRFSAQMARMNASQAMAGGFIGALSPLVGGFRSMGGTTMGGAFS